MKQLLLTLLSITAIGFSQFAQDGAKKPSGNNTNKINVHRPHKSHNYERNGSAWAFIDSTEYQYNVQGQVTSSISQTNGNYTERTFHNYDYLFQLTSETRDIYDPLAITWKPANKAQITYNDHFDETLHERSIYNAGNWEIYYGYKYVYQYNSSNQITEKIEFAYIDNVIEYRENQKFSDIVYDNNNNMTQQIISNWSGSQFVYYRKFIKTYNPDNTLATCNVFLWNSTTMNWDEEYRETYSYGLNGSNTNVCEYYISNNYEISFRRIIEFDSFQNLTLDVIEPWDNVTNNWSSNFLDKFENTYTYDQNDYLTQQTNLYATDSSSTIFHTRKDYFDFETFDSQLGIESIPEGIISIYPNPMETECTIDLSTLNGEVTSVRLFDMSGNLISELPLSANQKINFSSNDLSKGLYFLEIESTKRKIQSKIMVK
ncbi:T9SS type A sorting domain-containing protein [Fluviicola taffensis]|uniref:Secretion system C-terminal sorting domain-containing protein n=1 Tax=Fluviicola taffensis (strain DSM 16823 / NCIMB 13979 / RW262) TaxID=755732 RepID=F2IKD1_FLUTR|nr:T9SS type A sorting domain-containing protein [Fluviicola taffensis]AEA44034.1 hypothetical protein Fluta_2048 [Fluviicola taffensis DSM 16823]